MNLSYKILIGLFAGCLFGLFIAQSESQWLNWAAGDKLLRLAAFGSMPFV